jgi:FlaA1/EpsC-like NDP-sugar epimerase
MSMSQAVDLVVLALSDMRGGEVFIPRIGSASVATLADAIAPTATRVVTGLRVGEKLHEVLIGEDEAAHVREMRDHYVIEPAARTWDDHNWSARGNPVPARFRYASDTNPHQLSASELRAMVSERARAAA